MKKRIVAALLAGAMVFSLTACGGGGAVSSNDTGKNEENGEVNQTDGEESDPGLITATPESSTKRCTDRRTVCSWNHTGFTFTGYDGRMVSKCN